MDDIKSVSNLPYVTFISLNKCSMRILVGEGETAKYWSGKILGFLRETIDQEAKGRVIFQKEDVGSFIILELDFTDKSMSAEDKHKLIVRLFTIFYDKISKCRSLIAKEQGQTYDDRHVVREVQIVLSNQLFGRNVWWAVINETVAQEGRRLFPTTE